MGGEESSLSADLRLVKLISGKPEMSGEESPSRLFVDPFPAFGLLGFGFFFLFQLG